MLMVIIMPGRLPPGDGDGVYCNKVQKSVLLKMVFDGNITLMTMIASVPQSKMESTMI